jgi:hypothetical protein
LLAALRDRGFVPDYEMILERDYRGLIRAGDAVVDDGAHYGRHTVVFCELGGPACSVLAFEPLPMAFTALEARGLRSSAPHPAAPEGGYYPPKPLDRANDEATRY